MMQGAPVIREKDNDLKQLLLHRPTAQCQIGHRQESLPFPPQAGGWLQPQAMALPSPYHKMLPLGQAGAEGVQARGGLISLSLPPKHQEGLTEEIPALLMHVSRYSPGSKQRWKRWANTYICAAAASPGSPPT